MDKANDSEQKTVKLGYLHIDFEGRVAQYEPLLSITYNRNEKQELGAITLPSSNNFNTPWTFLIMQVWRDVYEPTGMTFTSVLDMIKNQVEVFMEEWLNIIQTDALNNNEIVARDIPELTARNSLREQIRKVVSNRHYGEDIKGWLLTTQRF